MDFRCAKCGMCRYNSVSGQYERSNGQVGLVNDGGSKCTDCIESDPMFSVGETVYVRAWWSSMRPVKCQVVSCDRKSDPVMDVQPVEGNPHRRFIRASDVILEKSNYRDEIAKLRTESKPSMPPIQTEQSESR